MISVLHKFKLRLHSEISLEMALQKTGVSSKNENKPMRGCCTVVVNQMLSLPQVFSAAKLKNQSSKKDEGILEKNGNSRVYYGFFFSNITSKENPHRCYQRAKGQHETNEQPNASTCLPHATFTVTVTPDLSVRYCIDH